MDNNFDNQTSENTPESSNVPEENVTAATENEYTDPNAGAVYTEPEKKQEPPKTTVSYTYGAPHHAEAEQSGDEKQSAGQGRQNTSYSYENAHYNNSNYGYNAGYQNVMGYQSDGMDTSPMSMGEWILTLLVSVIPCVGLIFYIIWAFEKNGNVNRRNYCRAALIMRLIGILICILFSAFIMVAGFSGFLY